MIWLHWTLQIVERETGKVVLELHLPVWAVLATALALALVATGVLRVTR